VAEQAMNRCECAGRTFRDLAAIARREGIEDFDILRRRTGCGTTCTACVPDLRAYLARARRARSERPVASA
jgi:bacterioferritin-associated ferredoxin